MFSVSICSWQHVSVIHCWVEPSLLLSSCLVFHSAPSGSVTKVTHCITEQGLSSREFTPRWISALTYILYEVVYKGCQKQLYWMPLATSLSHFCFFHCSCQSPDYIYIGLIEIAHGPFRKSKGFNFFFQWKAYLGRAAAGMWINWIKIQLLVQSKPKPNTQDWVWNNPKSVEVELCFEMARSWWRK